MTTRTFLSLTTLDECERELFALVERQRLNLRTRSRLLNAFVLGCAGFAAGCVLAWLRDIEIPWSWFACAELALIATFLWQWVLVERFRTADALFDHVVERQFWLKVSPAAARSLAEQVDATRAECATREAMGDDKHRVVRAPPGAQ